MLPTIDRYIRFMMNKLALVFWTNKAKIKLEPVDLTMVNLRNRVFQEFVRKHVFYLLVFLAFSVLYFMIFETGVI